VASMEGICFRTTGRAIADASLAWLDQRGW
jgi:hypothetical protein